MPEDGLDIAGCDLRNRKEIFGLEGLFNYTKFTFENHIICSRRVSANKYTFFISMAST